MARMARIRRRAGQWPFGGQVRRRAALGWLGGRLARSSEDLSSSSHYGTRGEISTVHGVHKISNGKGPWILMKTRFAGRLVKYVFLTGGIFARRQDEQDSQDKGGEARE